MIFKLIFKKKLIELEEKKNAYEDKKALLSKDLESLTWKNEEYIRQINILKEESGQFNRQIERLTWQKEQLNSKLNDTEQKNIQLSDHSKKLSEKLNSNESHINNLNTEIQNLNNTIINRDSSIEKLNIDIKNISLENRKIKINFEEIENQNQNLNLEITKLTKNIELLNNRLQRVKFLLNNRINPGLHCFIEETKTGSLVLNAINSIDHEIDVFDIDDTIFNIKESSAWIKLYPNMRKKEVFIQDRQADKKKGFVEVAMKHLLPFAKEYSKEELSIELTQEVLNDKDKLYTIYGNLGFIVKYFSNNNKE